MSGKPCSKCGVTRSVGQFRDRGNICVECARKRDREYYKSNREVTAERKRLYWRAHPLNAAQKARRHVQEKARKAKINYRPQIEVDLVCRRCGASGVPFGLCRYNKNGFKEECKKCRSELSKRYRERYPDRTKARHKLYRASERGKEVYREAARRWRQRHPQRATDCTRRYAAKNKQKLRSAKRRWVLANRKRVKQLQRKWYMNNKDYMRQKNLKALYGLTVAERDAIFLRQGLICGCCKSTAPGKRGWVVDHDHKTGAVRGILCHNCNLFIGAMGDTLSSVQSRTAQIVEYLKQEPAHVGRLPRKKRAIPEQRLFL